MKNLKIQKSLGNCELAKLYIGYILKLLNCEVGFIKDQNKDIALIMFRIKCSPNYHFLDCYDFGKCFDFIGLGCLFYQRTNVKDEIYNCDLRFGSSYGLEVNNFTEKLNIDYLQKIEVEFNKEVFIQKRNLCNPYIPVNGDTSHLFLERWLELNKEYSIMKLI